MQHACNRGQHQDEDEAPRSENHEEGGRAREILQVNPRGRPEQGREQEQRNELRERDEQGAGDVIDAMRERDEQRHHDDRQIEGDGGSEQPGVSHQLLECVEKRERSDQVGDHIEDLEARSDLGRIAGRSEFDEPAEPCPGAGNPLRFETGSRPGYAHAHSPIGLDCCHSGRASGQVSSWASDGRITTTRRAAMSTSGTAASVNGTSSVLLEPGEPDLQQIAGAVVLHGHDLADRLAVAVDGGQPDQVGVVELALGSRGQAFALDVERDALQGFGGVAVIDALQPRDHALRRRARALELERARAALVAERPVGADILRRLGVGLDQHLAADAVGTRDAAEQNAVGLGLGHGTYAAGLASPPSALAAASAAAASRSWRFFFGLAFCRLVARLRASSGRRRRGSATRGRTAARRPSANAWRAPGRASRGRRCPWAAADCACRSARCSGHRAARPPRPRRCSSRAASWCLHARGGFSRTCCRSFC